MLRLTRIFCLFSLAVAYPISLSGTLFGVLTLALSFIAQCYSVGGCFHYGALSFLAINNGFAIFLLGFWVFLHDSSFSHFGFW